MKILLAYPSYPDTFWSFKYALKFISKAATNPPLGLLTVAALLPAEWEQRLVDLNVTPLTDADLQWADYVLISAMTVQRESVKRIIERCLRAGVKTIGGGPLFTSEPENFPDLDYLVLDEAELTLPSFLKDLSNNMPRHIYRAEGWPDLALTPIPRWDLVDFDKYVSMCIQYSRGCPFECDFCDITALYGRKPRTKSKAQILAELESLYVHGWRGNVFIVDDNLIGNQKKLKEEILPALEAWMTEHRYPFSFYTQTSINLADDDKLMEMMVRVGFNMIFVGIETPNEESLTECGKYQNKRRDLVAAVKKIQRYGMQVQGGFIVGFDQDPLSIFEKQLDFIQKSGIVTAMVGILNVMRGTKLYQRLASENRIIRNGSGNNTDLALNYIPKMPMENLINGYKKLVTTIYSPEYFYRRVREFLKEYRPAFPKKTPKLSWRDLAAFSKSLIQLGILGEERKHYWKLLGWSLFTKPRVFPLAVECAIYGFHFRKIFGEYQMERSLS